MSRHTPPLLPLALALLRACVAMAAAGSSESVELWGVVREGVCSWREGVCPWPRPHVRGRTAPAIRSAPRAVEHRLDWGVMRGRLGLHGEEPHVGAEASSEALVQCQLSPRGCAGEHARCMAVASSGASMTGGVRVRVVSA